ncbi:hypothetical protein HK097_005920 [Rhizophlyctis rosea]|uniref:Uncharacterized protein n=1 Tax=Rhizophlyctis rosea TaxID=64517 RepID=A0AAD5X5C9_9FUNG|nr:hypothetical protein HK097_005920 [Rhizophlyctis rosea]
MFRAIRTLSTVASRPLLVKAPLRGFAQTPLVKGGFKALRNTQFDVTANFIYPSADVLTDLYLQELRTYKPAKDAAADKVDLPMTFNPPTPPAKPELEQALAQAEGGAVEAQAEEDWPPLYDPIDDPANYPDLTDESSDIDTGRYKPTRLKPAVYDH